MSTTEIEERKAPEAPGRAGADPREQRRAEVRDRLLLPLLLPLGAILVVVFFVLNLSRVFLAGSGTPAVIMAGTITVTILLGAAVISASPRLRTSSLALALAGAMTLLLSAGLVTLGHSEEKKGGPASAAPTGPAVNTLEVQALPALTFQAKDFSVPAGINQIDYVDKGGTHTLVFTDPKLSYFELKVPGGPTTGKAGLEAGKQYTVYCSIPGHRAAGMEAKITVGAAAPTTPGASTPAPGGGGASSTTTARGA